MSNETPITYLKLKTAEAQKLGRNGGSITYLILADAERRQLFLSIVGNSGGGYWSREIVPLEAVERCLPQDRSQPIAAKSLASSFTGRSSNNPTFLAAVLRSEKLLGPVEDKPHQHRIVGDWAAWTTALLAQEGEPYVPPVKAGEGGHGDATTAVEAGTADDTRSPPKVKKGRAGKPKEGGHAPTA